MGEAKIRQLNGGSARPSMPRHAPPGRVRIVPNIRLEAKPEDGVIVMMLGDTKPDLATAMTPQQARQLAALLLGHASQVEEAGRRIILPGE